MLHGPAWRRLMFGLVLGTATVLLIGTIAEGHVESRWHSSFEALLLPGGVVASVVSPGGVHGQVPWLWGPAILCGNIAFYTAAWVLVLLLVTRLRRSHEESVSST